MLYKLIQQETKTGFNLEPIPFQDLTHLHKLEKHLESLLAENLFGLLYEDARLFPIFRERSMQPEADIYALNENGDLFIFELKRGVAGSGAVHQLLRYTQEAGRWTYKQLYERYKTYVNDPSADLAAAHKEAFNLQDELSPSAFNRNQHLRIVGNAADEDLILAVEYWKGQKLSIDFIPYRIYEINGEYYFEFFSQPYDWHSNPSYFKGVLFDTNASWNPNSVWDMLEKKRVTAYGDAKKYARYLQLNDYVFYSHKGFGIIAAARVTSPTKEDGPDELYHDVEFLTPAPERATGIEKAMSFKKVQEMLGKSFYWARTIKVPYLNREESNILLEELKKVLSKDDH